MGVQLGNGTVQATTFEAATSSNGTLTISHTGTVNENLTERIVRDAASVTPAKMAVGPFSIDATGTTKRPDVFTTTAESGVTITDGSVSTLDPYWDVVSSCWVLSRHNEQISLNGTLVGGAGKFTTRTGYETATSTTLEFYGPASEGYGDTKFFTTTVSNGSAQGSVVTGFDTVGGTSVKIKNGIADLSDVFSESNTSLMSTINSVVGTPNATLEAALGSDS